MSANQKSSRIVSAISIDGRPISSNDTNTSRLDGTLSRDGRFRWSAGWEQWVPTGKEIRRPPQQIDFVVESGLPQQPRHSASCVCAECLTAGQRYRDYLKVKRCEF